VLDKGLGSTWIASEASFSRRHFLLRAAMPVNCGVQICRGMREAGISFDRSLLIAKMLESSRVLVEVIWGGGHRLPAAEDIEHPAREPSDDRR